MLTRCDVALVSMKPFKSEKSEESEKVDKLTSDDIKTYLKELAGRVLATHPPAGPEISSSAMTNSVPGKPTPLHVEKILRLSWTHWIELLHLEDPWKCAFYENECLKGNWSVRQLQRQIGSMLYERTGLSADKHAVIEAARMQSSAAPTVIADLIRDPYVLEFVGLAERPHYRESELEGALLDHLQSFLIELGAGFCFEARQKRITVGNEHDYIDLVFYHRRLRCHLLIDLKVRTFKHADLRHERHRRGSFVDTVKRE